MALKDLSPDQVAALRADLLAQLDHPQRLLVRCCCTPTKILGSLPAPPHAHAGLKVNFPIPTVVEKEFGTLQLSIESFFNAPIHRSELAYKAEETPLATLLKVPGFLPWSGQ